MSAQARRRIRRTKRAAVDLRDVLLGRVGDRPDALLGAVARFSPGAAGVLGTPGRLRAAGARERGLRFELVAGDPSPYAGRGQVVEFSGWIVHDQLPLHSASVLAEGRAHDVVLGYPRADIVARLARRGHRAPQGSGARVAVPLPPSADAREVGPTLRVRLVDGTVLERPLPPLTVLPGVGGRPVAVRWPGQGPRVAVCMATYAPQEDFLAQQLDSIRRQTHSNWVCLICDDGSSEEARKAIRAQIAGDDRFVLVENERNLGFYRNFERALRLVPLDADAVSLSDQDDVWDPDKLAVLLAELEDPDVQLVYSDMRLVDQDGVQYADSFWNRRRNSYDDLLALIQLNTVTGAACLARADLVRERVLPFPPARAFHDHWLALVALAAGRIAFVDRPLYSYRQHGSAVTGHREDDFGAGLPSLKEMGLAAWTADRPLPDHQRTRLEALAMWELPRLAQFAAVLLLRDGGRLAGPERSRLVQLTAADRRLRPLVGLTRLPESTREATTHADRQFVAAALWRRLQLRRRLDLPPRPKAAKKPRRPAKAGAGVAAAPRVP